MQHSAALRMVLTFALLPRIRISWRFRPAQQIAWHFTTPSCPDRTHAAGVSPGLRVSRPGTKNSTTDKESA